MFVEFRLGCGCWVGAPIAAILLAKRSKSALRCMPFVQLCSYPFPPALSHRRRGYMKKKNCAGSENHSPHYLRKRSHFGTEYRKASPPRKGKVNGDQEG